MYIKKTNDRRTPMAYPDPYNHILALFRCQYPDAEAVKKDIERLAQIDWNALFEKDERRRENIAKSYKNGCAFCSGFPKIIDHGYFELSEGWGTTINY
jgi:hypothetical protein